MPGVDPTVPHQTMLRTASDLADADRADRDDAHTVLVDNLSALLDELSVLT